MTSLRHRLAAATVAIAATFVTVAAAAPAHAATGAITETRAVPHADLNLATVEGQQTLARRIRHAAKAVCGEMDRGNRDRVARCREHAVAGAQADMRIALARAAAAPQIALR